MCLKNWDTFSEAMETESIVKFVLEFLEKNSCYTCDIVMDDDTTTPAYLGEDNGENRNVVVLSA